MAEYYDVVNAKYYNLLSRSNHDERIKLELLDHYENCIGSIESDIDGNDSGSIVSNNEQGTRKSCSFTLINVDENYTIDENNFFWFNRKFKLYKGITDGIDTFWFSKGIFITQSADTDSTSRTVSITGTDKYGQLDGTLKVLQGDEMDTVFEIGTKIEYVVKDLLMLDLGNGFVLDPIEPIIDPEIGNQKLYKEYTMSAGSYFGEFLSEVMSSFGCDIFYDNIGRLTVRRVFNDDIAHWYAYKAPIWSFDFSKSGYISPKLTSQLTGINKLTVKTDNTDSENASYTAYNNNPRSPLCYSKIGARVLEENAGVIYISSGNEHIDTPEIKCKEYAEYRLLKETCMNLSISFNCSCIPHLNEGDIILISDSRLLLDNAGFLIQSITDKLDTGEMSISAVNLQYLPTDIYNDSNASLSSASNLNKIHIVYDLNGGIGTPPESQIISYYQPFSPTFLTAESEIPQKHGYEFIGWDENKNNITAKYSSATDTYSCPNDDTTLYAIYENTDNYCFKAIINDTSVLSGYEFSTIPCFAIKGATIEYVMANDTKYYIKQINSSNEGYNLPKISIPTSGAFTFTHGTTKSNWDKMVIQNISNEMCNNMLGLANGTTAGTKFICPKSFPNTIKDLSGFLTGVTVDEIEFPQSEMYFINNGTAITYGIFAITKLQNINLHNSIFTKNCSLFGSCDNLKSIMIDGDLSCESDKSILVIGDNNALESIIINGDLSIERGNYLYSNAALSTLKLRNVTAKVNSTYTSYFVYPSNTPSATINEFAVQDILLSGQVMAFYGYTYACPFVVSGNIKLLPNSDTESGTNYPSFMVSNKFSSDVIFKGDFYSEGGLMFAGNQFLNSNGKLVFEKDVTMLNNNSASAFVGTSGLVAIEFHGKVNLGSGIFNGNSSLSDIYFYNDDIVYGNNVFTGSSSNLVIHGVADNGNAKSLADTLNASFVLIEG